MKKITKVAIINTHGNRFDKNLKEIGGDCRKESTKVNKKSERGITHKNGAEAKSIEMKAVTATVRPDGIAAMPTMDAF